MISTSPMTSIMVSISPSIAALRLIAAKGTTREPRAAKVIVVLVRIVYQQTTPTQMLKTATEKAAPSASRLTVSIHSVPSMIGAAIRIGMPPSTICQGMSG